MNETILTIGVRSASAQQRKEDIVPLSQMPVALI